jgi:type II secretory pathway pseudopilin PulG
MPTSTAGKPPSKQRGFTYVIVLVAVVTVGVLAGAATTMSSRLVQADREAELLMRGLAYQRAIKSYYEAVPAAKTYPRQLNDLLDDPRFPSRHHLRALYRDPFASDERSEWTIVRAADGGIVGVASIGAQEPLKKANFPKELERFGAAKSYADWVFMFEAPPATSASTPPIAPMKR